MDENSNLDFGNNFSVSDNNLNKSQGVFFLGNKRNLSTYDLVKEYKEDIQSSKSF